jgi:hypothetical protein
VHSTRCGVAVPLSPSPPSAISTSPPPPLSLSLVFSISLAHSRRRRRRLVRRQQWWPGNTSDRHIESGEALLASAEQLISRKSLSSWSRTSSASSSRKSTQESALRGKRPELPLSHDSRNVAALLSARGLSLSLKTRVHCRPCPRSCLVSFFR